MVMKSEQLYEFGKRLYYIKPELEVNKWTEEEYFLYALSVCMKDPLMTNFIFMMMGKIPPLKILFKDYIKLYIARYGKTIQN